jgi:hypothetical protein
MLFERGLPFAAVGFSLALPLSLLSRFITPLPVLLSEALALCSVFLPELAELLVPLFAKLD